MQIKSLIYKGTHMAKEENLFEEKAKEEGGKPAANTDKLKALRAAMDKIEKKTTEKVRS